MALNDSMCVPAAHWVVSDVNQAGCSFINGAYYAYTGKGFSSCDYLLSSFSNFVYQIQVKFVKDNTCGGIIFRVQPTSIPPLTKYYSFLICSDGTYELTYENPLFPQLPLINQSSPFIHQGIGQTNVIGVVANGTRIDLYINRHMTEGTNDSNASTGKIGIGVQNLTGSDTLVVAFNDAKLWAL